MKGETVFLPILVQARAGCNGATSSLLLFSDVCLARRLESLLVPSSHETENLMCFSKDKPHSGCQRQLRNTPSPSGFGSLRGLDCRPRAVGSRAFQRGKFLANDGSSCLVLAEGSSASINLHRQGSHELALELYTVPLTASMAEPHPNAAST